MPTSRPAAEAAAPAGCRWRVLALAVLALGVVVWLRDWHLGADSAVYRAGALTLLHGDRSTPGTR